MLFWWPAPWLQGRWRIIRDGLEGAGAGRQFMPAAKGLGVTHGSPITAGHRRGQSVATPAGGAQRAGRSLQASSGASVPGRWIQIRRMRS